MVNIWSLFPSSLSRSARSEVAFAPPDSTRTRFNELCALAKTYLKTSQIHKLRRAYEFALTAHRGQHRLSGEPYIEHPLAVAKILAGMHMDHETLSAAILHDVLEDTPTQKETIRAEFGEEVAYLVDGVSKLTQMEFGSYAEAQAENFRKMLMAMSKDIRVILVKLADRLHNMRTLGALALEKRRLIARETLDIYVPIAQRLGINSIRLELEDLGFATLYPQRYRVLAEEVKKARGHRKELVIKIKNTLKHRLRQESLSAQVYGREKHLYSIYKKMQIKRRPFSEIFDVYAFRIIVDTADTAYRVLGVVHSLFKPVPGKFKDYIAIPKSNGYQSLHTALFGPHGIPIEVQIRTREMNEIAEAGIAAHWLYKAEDNSLNSAHKRAREWLKGLLEMQKEAGNSEEFLENVKIDLFPDEIYVFTPKGEIMKLPHGATAVDFGYTVHTDIGAGCVAARVNRILAPLRTPLATGDTVEIITAPGATPNPAWLNFVVTAKARSHIRHFLKNLQQDEARRLGERMLNRELDRFSLSLGTVPTETITAVLTELKLDSLAPLLEDVGLGKRMAPIVARYFLPAANNGQGSSPLPLASATTPLAIKGTEGMVVSFPKCCHPIPGDAILGHVSAGRGIVIHRQNCNNVAEYRNHPEKWVDLEWGNETTGEFSVEIRAQLSNERGALATVAAVIANQDANIELVEMSERDESYATLTLIIAVHDRVHLANILRVLRRLPPVNRIARTRG